MRRPDPALAIGVAGVAVAVATVGVGVAQLELAAPHANVLSNPWLVGAIFIAGIGGLGAVVVFMANLLGRRGDTTDPPIQTSASEGSANHDATMTPTARPEPAKNKFRQPHRGWAGLVFAGFLILGGAATGIVTSQVTIEMLLPTESVLLGWLIPAAVTLMALTAAGSLGVALAEQGRDRSVYVSIDIVVTAVAWLVLGVALFFVQWRLTLSIERQYAIPFGAPLPGSIQLLPRPAILTAVFFGAIYLVSGACTIFQSKSLRTLSAARQAEWFRRQLSWARPFGVSVLILAAAATDTVAFQNTLDLVLPQETALLTLLIAAGVTFMALAAAGSLGVVLADRRRHGTTYGSFDIVTTTGVWVALGVAMFLIRWLGTSASPRAAILTAFFFGAIYLVSGVCAMFQAERLPKYLATTARPGPSNIFTE
jgi:hypothetical protein